MANLSPMEPGETTQFCLPTQKIFSTSRLSTFAIFYLFMLKVYMFFPASLCYRRWQCHLFKPNRYVTSMLSLIYKNVISKRTQTVIWKWCCHIKKVWKFLHCSCYLVMVKCNFCQGIVPNIKIVHNIIKY